MIRLIFLFIILTITILLYTLTDWFSTQKFLIDKINYKYKQDIKKLKQIPSLNQTIKLKVLPHIHKIPKNEQIADLILIDFFDTHAKNYNLFISKYIYTSNTTRCMQLKFSISRSDKILLSNFLKLKINEGFIKFQYFKVKKEIFEGEILLVQPFLQGESDAPQ
jgi:hypothetical protein